MNISLTNKDELNAVLNLKIEPVDYEKRVDKILNEQRRKVQMKGFRPGKVPVGLVKKMYGKAILVEEINKLVSESLAHYIHENKLNVLGDPMPCEDEEFKADFENPKDFEFSFDVGLFPEIDVTLTEKDKFTYYKVVIDSSMIDTYTEELCKRYGKHETIDTVTEDSMLRGDFSQLDQDGNPRTNGIVKENALITVKVIKDEKIKEDFLKLKQHDVISFDIRKAYPNDTELSALLGVPKDSIADMEPMFEFLIMEISVFVEAEVNQKLFDKVYGVEVVKSVEEFRTKISDSIQEELIKEEEFRFSIDTREKMLDMIDFELPEKFLKRWLLRVNKEKITEEKLNEEFPLFKKDMKWQLIKNKMTKLHEIKISDEDVKTTAREFTLAQFHSYGMYYPRDEYIDRFVEDIMGNDAEKRDLFNKCLEDKIIAIIKANAKIVESKISREEFNNLYNTI